MNGKKTQRLDKVLSHMGYGTRSELKRYIRLGMVEVNGVTVKDGGMQVDPYDDEITVGGERVRFREYVYLMLNKPKGVVSATEDARDRTVIDLLADEYRHFAPFPVGRLDKDTEGLLLLTNDGKLAHRLLSPRKHVPKTYVAEVEGDVDEQDRRMFAEGVTLDDGYVTMPAKLDILDRDVRDGRIISRVELTIVEGKFHQVKRMFKAVGKRVVSLRRTAMGPLKLDETLAPGEYRELSEQEQSALATFGTGE